MGRHSKNSNGLKQKSPWDRIASFFSNLATDFHSPSHFARQTSSVESMFCFPGGSLGLGKICKSHAVFESFCDLQSHGNMYIYIYALYYIHYIIHIILLYTLYYIEYYIVYIYIHILLLLLLLLLLLIYIYICAGRVNCQVFDLQ